jgi:REP element-mobilizing transposase RayT
MSDDKYKNKYRIPSNRLQGYDYGSNGCYYVTICTKNHAHYFGEIVDGARIETDNVETRNVETRLIASLRQSQPQPQHKPIPRKTVRKTEIGNIAEKFWLEIPIHFPFVILDQFVIMPNHIHGILFFNKTDEMQRDDVIRKDAINRVSTTTTTKKIGGITGIYNPMFRKNLGRILRWFKGRVSFECRSFIDFAWQERFHDSIIRDNAGLDNVRTYIFNNPQNWNDDKYNEKQLTP